MKKTFAVFLIMGALFSGQVLAFDFYQGLKDHQTVLKNIRSSTAANSSDGTCSNRYNGLYQDGKLDILLAFGYTETLTGNLLFDWYMVDALARVLTEPCVPGIKACGFIRAKNTDRYFKNVTGPDGKRKLVELTMIRPSLTWDHRKNVARAQEQLARCERVEDKFHQSIEGGTEIVYYSGHSRDGGGPDFCPPRVIGTHVDYNYYRRNRPGLRELLESLRTSNGDLQLLALHSCSSLPHFRRSVRNLKPELALLGTTRSVDMMPDFQNIYGGIDSLLALRCAEGFRQSTARGLGTSLVGF